MLKTSAEPAIFQMALKCYVRSGIPVVLHLQLAGEGHAVTVVGFREGHPKEDPAPLVFKISESHSLRSAGVSRLYVHDDRLGPYARMRWLPWEKEDFPRLQFYPSAPGYEKFVEPAFVWGAIVPLYPKLRLVANDLISLAGELLPLFKLLARKQDLAADMVSVDLRFSLSGSYMEQLLRRRWLSPERCLRFVRSVHLSRYVGVIEYWVGDQWLADVLCDTTDIRRPETSRGVMLAVLPRFEEHFQAVKQALSTSPLPLQVI
jgi:hypothetical protein